jgi:hypothetical protein
MMTSKAAGKQCRLGQRGELAIQLRSSLIERFQFRRQGLGSRMVTGEVMKVFDFN